MERPATHDHSKNRRERTGARVERSLVAHVPGVLRVAWPVLVVVGLLTILAAGIVSLEATGHREGLEQIASTGQTRTAVSAVNSGAASYDDLQPGARSQARADLRASIAQSEEAHSQLMAVAETELSGLFESHQRLERVSATLDYTFEQMQRAFRELEALSDGERLGFAETPEEPAQRLAELSEQYLFVLDHIDLKVANSARDKLMRLQYYEAGAIAAAGLLLIILALAVMRPSHLVISRQIGQLKSNRGTLAEAMIAAERVALDRERLLYALSHDVRAPLQTILLNVEIMRHRGGALADSDEIDRIARSAQHVKTLLDDLLNKGAKLEEAAFNEVDVTHMLEDLVETYAAQASERGLMLAAEAEPQLPPLMASESALRRVLDNLLTNAIKYTDEGQVTLRAQAKTFGDERFVSIDVVDTGSGLSEDQIHTVFEERRRLPSDQEGHGLGLAIARRLVNEELHGELLVSSTVGEGSTFSVVIPVAATGELTPSGWKPEDFLERLRQTGVFEDLVAVVVGDVRAADEIRQLGARVVSSDEDLEGLSEVVSGLSEVHQVVVFDADLLDERGCSLCSELREVGFDGPLVGMYSDAIHTDREQLITSGCNALLRKPVTAVDLVEWLARGLTHFHTDIGDEDEAA